MDVGDSVRGGTSGLAGDIAPETSDLGRLEAEFQFINSELDQLINETIGRVDLTEQQQQSHPDRMVANDNQALMETTARELATKKTFENAGSTISLPPNPEPEPEPAQSREGEEREGGGVSATRLLDGLKGWGLRFQSESSSFLSSSETVTRIWGTKEQLLEIEKQKELFLALGTQPGSVKVLVNAGESLKIPFVLGPGIAMTWTFTILHYDLDFKVLLRKAASGGSLERVLRTQKCVAGKIYAGGILPSKPNSSTRHISIVFDNSSSLLRPKSVSYIIELGAELVYDVDVSDDGSPSLYISADSVDEGDSEIEDGILEKPNLPSSMAQQALTALKSVGRRLQLHDSDNPLEDEINDFPVVEIVKEKVSSIGEGIFFLGSEAVKLAKQWQLHDNEPDIPPSSVVPEEHPKSAPTKISSKSTPTSSASSSFSSSSSSMSPSRSNGAAKGDPATLSVPVTQSGPMTQWVSEGRSKSLQTESLQTENDLLGVETSKIVAPLLLNKLRSIEPATFEQLWASASGNGDLTLAAAVTPLHEESDPTNFFSTFILHLEFVGAQVVAQSIVPGGMRLFVHAEGLKLPITPSLRPVSLLSEIIFIRSGNADQGQYWLLSLTARSLESNFLEHFVLSLRLGEIVQAFNDGSRGRGRALALLGLPYN